MRRRIYPDDFEHSAKLMDDESEGAWFVCDEYRIRGDAIVAVYGPSDGEANWRPYLPLKAKRDLFFRFARLHKEPDFESAALEWVHKYGVLESKGDRFGRLRKGERVPLSVFRQEAKRAWIVLMMYEAALNGDAQSIRSILSEHQNEEPIRSLSATFKYQLSVKAWLPETSVENLRKRDLLNFAYFMSLREVDRTVQELCYQSWTLCFRAAKNGFVFGPEGPERQWRFESLLGAMYLQMYWLIEAGSILTRCEWCGNIISHSAPASGERKVRSDKRFCGDACRQSKHRSKAHS